MIPSSPQQTLSTVSTPTQIPVVIDYDHPPEGLRAAQSAIALPLLPVGRTTLLEKQLAWLRQCGFRNVFIHLQEGREDVQQFLEHRGCAFQNVQLTQTPYQQDLPRLLSEGVTGNGQGVLLMSGHFLGSFFLPGLYHHSMVFYSETKRQPICFIAAEILRRHIHHQGPKADVAGIVAALARRTHNVRTLRLVDPSFTINDLADYRDLNRRLNFIEGRDILIGANSHVAPDCEFIGPNLIGDDVVIEPGCRIGPYVTLADGAKIGRDCTLRDTIVARNTAIPAGSVTNHFLILNDHTLMTSSGPRCLPAPPPPEKPRPSRNQTRFGVTRRQRTKAIWDFFGHRLCLVHEQSEAVGLWGRFSARGRHA